MSGKPARRSAHRVVIHRHYIPRHADALFTLSTHCCIDCAAQFRAPRNRQLPACTVDGGHRPRSRQRRYREAMPNSAVAQPVRTRPGLALRCGPQRVPAHRRRRHGTSHSSRLPPGRSGQPGASGRAAERGGTAARPRAHGHHRGLRPSGQRRAPRHGRSRPVVSPCQSCAVHNGLAGPGARG